MQTILGILCILALLLVYSMNVRARRATERKRQAILERAKHRAKLREDKRLSTQYYDDSYMDGIDFNLAMESTNVVDTYDQPLFNPEQQKTVDKIFKFHSEKRENLNNSGVKDE